MNLFDVYPLWDIEPVKGLDTTLWDKNGEVYTDLYGGHAVISVGHSHPHYVKMLTEQLNNLGFYSFVIKNLYHFVNCDRGVAVHSGTAVDNQYFHIILSP